MFKFSILNNAAISHHIYIFMLYDMNNIPMKYFTKVFHFNLIKSKFNFQFTEDTEDRGAN